MKNIERMANHQRGGWFGSEEQKKEYYCNEFNAGFVFGIAMATKLFREWGNFITDSSDDIAEIITCVNQDLNKEVEGKSKWNYCCPMGEDDQMKPFVTVVVPFHLSENQKYLNWCLNAIKESVGIGVEILCFSSAKYAPDTPYGVELFHDPEKYSNVTKKYTAGYKMSHPGSKYMMYISDDVMVSKHTIAELADTIGDSGLILNPASNCDATTRYYSSYSVSNEHGVSKQIPLKTTMEDMVGYQQAIIDYPKERRVLIDPGWVSFYCTMIPKSVMKAVGPLDEKLDVRHNDVDYCHRARKIGVPSMINLGVFACHFGDRTLPKCTTSEMYGDADKAFQEKYMPVPEEQGDLL